MGRVVEEECGLSGRALGRLGIRLSRILWFDPCHQASSLRTQSLGLR